METNTKIRESKPEKKPRSLAEIFLSWKVSQMLRVLDEFGAKKYAAQHPDKTFGDMIGEILDSYELEVKAHPEIYNLPTKQIK